MQQNGERSSTVVEKPRKRSRTSDDGRERLDAYAKPPDGLKAIYKQYQKIKKTDLCNHNDLLDYNTSHGSCQHDRVVHRGSVSQSMPKACLEFTQGCQYSPVPEQGVQPSAMYEVADLPGLFIYPNLLNQAVQLRLLDKLFHRDLSNAEHQTNVHMHYDVPYPSRHSDGEVLGSYFDSTASDLEFIPKDRLIHKPITTDQFLNKKLRWVTLGGQYDWTKKVYPSGDPPPFPEDIKQLIEEIFPMKAEAAIVNLYSPGDTLSLHRDVSEECDQPLVSISLGCDGIFIAGLDGDDKHNPTNVVAMRLRSGDAVLMSGRSRYAWHGVPKVLEGTCPDLMEDWPCSGSDETRAKYERWKGWMKGKRINLNVRQMFA